MLLTTLIGLMLLSGMVVALQVRTQAGVRVLARLEARHVEAMAVTAILARTAAGLAGRGPAHPLRGIATEESFAGRTFAVRLTDVEGLVDLYLAPPEVLALLGVPDIDLAAAREAALAPLVPGERFATKVQLLARLGLDAQTRAAVAGLTTQSARTGEINPTLAPDSIQAISRSLEAVDLAAGQSAEVDIRPLSVR